MEKKPDIAPVSASCGYIEIASQEDLEQIRNNPNENYILVADIILSSSFLPIESFGGILDGNGHKISGFELVTGDVTACAFINHNNGIIKNLGFASVVVHREKSDKECYASGLVGINNGVIERCYATGNISGAYRSGGLAAYNKKLILNSYFVGYVSAEAEAGGICAIAEANSEIRNCYTQATVYSDSCNTGAITAYAYTGTVISDSVALSGHIGNAENKNLANIVGYAEGNPSLKNNYSSENALVQTVSLSFDDPTCFNGETVLNEDTNRSLFEKKLGWDLTTVWRYDKDSVLRRPVLAGLEEEMSEKYIREIVSTKEGKVADGLTYSLIHFIDTNFIPQSMTVFKLDYVNTDYDICVGTKDDAQPPTDENGNYIRYETPEGHDVMEEIIPNHLSSTAAARHKTVYAGVNGEFYVPQGPEGYMIKNGGRVINGARISSPEKSFPFHGFFGIRKNADVHNRFVIGTYDNDWEREYRDLYQATGGQFVLIKNGKLPYYGDLMESVPGQRDYERESFYRLRERHPRTAVGYDDRYLYLVVVDGRLPDAVGVYVEELALIMKYLGCTESINMDGGGSTTAVIYNTETKTYDLLNHPSNTIKDGVEYSGSYLRPVFSSVLIVEK